MSAMDKSKIKREICDRITKLSYKRPKTEKEHNMIHGAKIELEDLLETIRASDGNTDNVSTELSINYDGLLDAVNCEVCGTKLSEQEKEGGNCCDECWLRN
jgi:hypothetical protein